MDTLTDDKVGTQLGNQNQSSKQVSHITDRHVKYWPLAIDGTKLLMDTVLSDRTKDGPSTRPREKHLAA